MADSNTAYPPPSPAPTLPTPQAPGFFPETPAAGAYRHDEGPLDAAGRALPKDAATSDKGALGGALLGVGVGALFGGPLGALVGGSVGGIAGLEEQGLRSKFGSSPAGQQQVTEERTATALQQSPAQRLVGNDGDGSVSALLAGGAGAHVVDRELDEPVTEQVEPGTLSGLPVADESIVDMSTTTPSQSTPAEEKADDGLTGNQKAALGAGAGLAAGGLAGAALASHNDDHTNAVSKFDSPYTPGVNSAPGPPLSTNPALVGESTVTPAPITQQQPAQTSTATTNVIHNPEYTPAPIATTNADQTVANDDPTKLEKAAPYAGAAALAGAGAATALPRDDYQEADQHDKNDLNANETVADDSPSRLEKAAPYAGAAALGAGAATALPRQDTQEIDRLDKNDQNDQHIQKSVAQDSVLEQAAPSAGAAAGGASVTHSREVVEDAGTTARPDNSPDEDVPGVTDEAVDGKRKAAETAAGAALGAAGGATAVEAVEKAGGGHEDVEFPAKEDPAAALAAQLAGKDSISPQSRFYEGLDGAPSPAGTQSRPAHLTSRFSDATVDTVATNATEDTIDGAHGGFEDQRAVAPVPLFRQGSYLAEGDDEPTPTKNHKIDTEVLAATTAAATVPGFANPDQTSSAFQDFAHLSQPESAASTSAITPVGAAELDVPQDVEEEEEKDGYSKGALAASALGGGVIGGGLAAAYAAQHEGQRTPPSSTSAPTGGNDSRFGTATGVGAGAGAGAAALPHSPKHLNLRDQLGEGSEYSPSTPSSTRAMKGSPTHTGATTPASFTQQGEYTPPMREQAAFIATPEGANQGDYYAGNKDHQSTFSSQTPRQQSAETTRQPEEQSSYDAQQQFQQQQQYHPVEHSPHMKIATRKDSIGHNRLHKKSLGDPSQQQQQQQRSPILAGGEHGVHSPARAGSPLSSGSARTTEGEGIWNGAVANVVNDETVHRGGHRPGLVTIDSENRRDNVMDRMVGVSDPTHSAKNSPTSTHSRNKSTSSQHGGDHVPPTTSASSTPRKLTRGRRSSSVTQPNPNPAFGPDGFRVAHDEAEPVKKEGFVSKLFGGHKRTASKNSPSGGAEGAGSSRGSLEGRPSAEGVRQ